MEGIFRGIKTRPLLLIFAIFTIICYLLCNLWMNVRQRHKDYITVNSVGEIYAEPWNGSGDFIFKTGNKKILIKGQYLSSDTVEKLKAQGSGFLKAKITVPQVEGNFYMFDYSKYLASHGVDGYLYAQDGDFSEDGTAKHSLWYYAARVRYGIHESLVRYLGEDTSAWIMSIMTGDTGALDRSDKNIMSLAGFSHLIAVSGAHVVFLTQPFAFLLRKFHLSLGKKHIILLAPAVFLWFVAGGSASVTRAVLMCVISAVSICINRNYDGGNALGIAGVVQLVSNPFSVFGSGFILSYGATLSIIVIMPVLKKLLPKNRLVSALLPGIAVNIGILPIMLRLFNSVSICGILLNSVAAELAALLCTGGYAVVIMDRILLAGGMTEFLSKALIPISGGLEALAASLASGQSWFFRIECGSPNITLILVYYVILTGIIFGKRGIAFVTSVFVLCGFFAYNSCKKLTVYFVDVGQGSCTFIKTSDGVAGLVDTGNGDTDVAEFLKKTGVKKLDFVVISHGHDDHYGGLEELCESYEPEIIYAPDNANDTYCQKLCESHNTVYVSGEKVLKLGKFTTMYMAESLSDTTTDDLNNGSIVVKLEGKWGSLLLPGDAEEETLEELEERGYNFNAEVLCLAHHGSITSGSSKFLCNVNPKYVIISVGYGNSYGHPSEIVLDRVAELGISDARIYRTDTDGAVRLEFGTGPFMKEFVYLWRKKMRVFQ